MSEHALPSNPAQWPKDPRKLLGLGSQFDRRLLRQVYTKLIRLYKPEHAPAEFALIRAAYERLEQELAWRQSFRRHDADDASAEGPIRDQGEDEDSDPPAEREHLPSPQAVPVARDPLPWDLALADDWDAAYSGLRALSRRGTADSEAYCQIYWLLKLQPTLDSSQRPTAWLNAGLARHPNSPELQELYCEELRSRPAEVLETGADALLENGGSLHWLRTLATERWKAAGLLDRYELIGNDLNRLRRRFTDDRPAWLHLQVAAVEQLCRSADPAAGELAASCNREIATLADLQLKFHSLFDRHELLTTYSARLRAAGAPSDSDDFLHKWNPSNRRRPEYSSEMHRLLLDLHVQSPADLWEPLLLLLEYWMNYPEAGQAELDDLDRRNHSAVLRIQQLVASLLSATGTAPTPPETNRLLDFLDLNPVRSYAELRTSLQTFCLEEATTLLCVAEIVAQRPEYDAFHGQRLSDHLQADAPLQTLLLGIHTFWQA